MAGLGKSVPIMFRKEGVWTPELNMYVLWFRFLKLSPSYELARRYRSGLFTKADDRMVPNDFDIVLSAYDRLGDVISPSFLDWWQRRGIDHFGYHGDKPTVRTIATLKRREGGLGRFLDEAKTYMEGKWRSEGLQTTLIVAIPLVLSKARILKKVAQFIDETDIEQKRLRATSPTYKLYGRKHDEASLVRYSDAVKFRALNPNDQLWEIGMMADVSQTYGALIRKKSGMGKKPSSEDKNALKILTSRAISRGLSIAENAARGRFPSYRPCLSKVRFDKDQMLDLVRRGS